VICFTRGLRWLITWDLAWAPVGVEVRPQEAGQSNLGGVDLGPVRFSKDVAVPDPQLDRLPAEVGGQSWEKLSTCLDTRVACYQGCRQAFFTT